MVEFNNSDLPPESEVNDRSPSPVPETISAIVAALRVVGEREGTPDQINPRQTLPILKDILDALKQVSPTLGAPGAGATATHKLPEIPGYTILGELGRGGMGVVYQATQNRLRRMVAIKMVLKGECASERERARFNEEAEVVAKVQHTNIVQIHEIGEYEGNPYFCQEYVDGGSLDKKLAATPQPFQEAAILVETLARAMHEVHARGVIHRDLKPANILLTKNGVPKIADFGLARDLEGSRERTVSGAIMGTPSYMAPEQGSAKQSVGAPADIYALGAIFYEMLVGRPPFKASTPMDTIMEVITKDPVAPRRLRANTPRDLEVIALKCLEKLPERRYATAAALADDLNHYLHNRSIMARPPNLLVRAGKAGRRHRTAVTATATAVVVAGCLAMLGGWFVNHQRQLQAQFHLKEGNRLLEQAVATAQEDDARTDFENAAHEFFAAQVIGVKNAEAEQGLWKVSLCRCERALGRGANDLALGILVQLKDLNGAADYKGQIESFERRARGIGSWQLETDPPNCDASLIPIDAEFKNRGSVKLGATPFRSPEIAPGSYFVVLNHPGWEELKYPFLVERGENKTIGVSLIPKGQVPEGMVYVPPGEFLYGEASAGAQVKCRVAGFFMDKTEVTGAEFEKYVLATGAPKPESWQGASACPSPLRDAAVYNVSWFEAVRYAHWAGKRLPHEKEWEWAARGADGRAFPWGNSFDPRKCEWHGSPTSGLQVGHWRDGASPFGCLDMAGNVWEWTLDREMPNSTDRVIRGGAAYSNTEDLVTYRRKNAPPGGSDFGGLALVGLRCVKPLSAEPRKPSFLDEIRPGDLGEAAEFYWHTQPEDPTKKLQLTKECTKRLLQLNPRSVAGNFWKGLYLQSEGDLEGALSALKIAYFQQLKFPRRWQFSTALRNVLEELKNAGRPADAEFLNFHSYVQAGNEAMDQQDYPKADKLLKKALAIDPQNRTACELMAQNCEELGLGPDALDYQKLCAKDYRLLLREDPDDPELQYIFAEFLRNTNLNREEGLAAAQLAVKLDNGKANYHALLADFLIQADRRAEAIEHVKKAVDLDPTEPSYREKLLELQTPPRK